MHSCKSAGNFPKDYRGLARREHIGEGKRKAEEFGIKSVLWFTAPFMS